jgi:hypothetical protein
MFKHDLMYAQIESMVMDVQIFKKLGKPYLQYWQMSSPNSPTLEIYVKGTDRNNFKPVRVLWLALRLFLRKSQPLNKFMKTSAVDFNTNRRRNS